MSENKKTRSQRNKPKKNGRLDIVMKLSIGLLVMALMVLLLELFYPGSNQKSENDILAGISQEEESSVIESSEVESELESGSSSSSSEEPEESEESGESKESKVEETEIREVTSTDPNVIKAYAGDWAPIGTNQTGAHVTNYEDGSADRIEIKRASSQATGVPESDIVEYWIGNDGEQRVTATIMQVSTQRYYKVYLSWIEGEGWQVTRYDEIKQLVQ